jgi:hypothetical protein
MVHGCDAVKSHAPIVTKRTIMIVKEPQQGRTKGIAAKKVDEEGN